MNVPGAVMADGAIQCVMEDCEVAHVGTYGIWIPTRLQGLSNSAESRATIWVQVACAWVRQVWRPRMWRSRADRRRLTTTFSMAGHVYAAGVGIWVAQSSHNQISHNDIHDFLYSGISVGWNWGVQKNRTHHNVIEFNHVHDLVHGTLSDAGLIYCLGVSPGSVIRNNVFHDMWPYSRPALGWGIYLDARCGNYTIENNLVYNTLSVG